MSVSSLEARIEIMEQAYARLNHELERAKDYIAIQNLASRYQYYHQPKTMAKTFDLFAQHTPGVSVGISAGVDEELERVKEFWTKPSSIPFEGVMLEHHLTTPIIEVAEDGQTAKGVWMSPGHETVPGLLPGGHWVWGRYAIDFVKEKGEWKIWHLWFYPTFRTRVGRDWVEGPEAPLEALAAHRAKYPFSRPLPYLNLYTRDSVREMVPVPPDPYITFEPYDPTGGAQDERSMTARSASQQ
jgi:SnoaL-like domain